ncbi:RHS repeat domain-containing protein [Paenibacillus chartarius]|uniref:RHS repeat domain-containing protein n=1 Tax=Paenibacillus chartarius TaxID=747481 RepID=A0ABV6DEN1_9BACL
MHKLIHRIITLTLLVTIIFGSLPTAFSNQVYAAEMENPIVGNTIAESRRQQLKEIYAISESDLQSKLDQGYTLEEIEAALLDRKSTGNDLGASLEKIKPRPVNNSRIAKSTITSDVAASSFTTMTATSGSIPDYSYVNTKPDEAPYTVRLDQETVSTLSGSLSLRVADLSLPGRNGLGFTLSRIFDSGSSQFDQMVTYGGTSNGTTKPKDESMYPIGKGWSWNLSYIETSGADKFLHLADSGVFKIDSSNNLLGYPWKDLTFASDTTVTVGTATSAYSLKSIQGISQYFDASGHLIQIKDTYNNTIQFTWSTDPTYGTVLTKITDAINNAITITYGTHKVVLTKGSMNVTYYKTIQNEKELLTQVIDPIGRATTYDYAIKDAYFNLLGTTPTTKNPYALLTGVIHPTGAKTVYTYESTPITRYLGERSVNQVYRIQSREERVTLSNATVQTYNHKDITYPSGDIGSSYNTDIDFTVAVSDGLTTTTFTNQKDYIDENNSPVFYNLKVVSQTVPYNGVTYTNTTDYSYDRARKWPVPIATKVTRSASNTGNTYVINTSTTYDDYGNVTSMVNPDFITTVNTYDPISHLLVGVSQPISQTQTRYTEYVRDSIHGRITAVRVRDGGITGPILQETKNTAFDSYGNVTQMQVSRAAGVYTTVRTDFKTDSPYFGAFPTQQTIQVTDADSVTSNIIKKFDYNSMTGALIKYTDANTNVTNYEYDTIGRLTKVIHAADGSSAAITYFDYLNQIQMTDETGVQSQTSWNPVGYKIHSGTIEGGQYKNKITYGYDGYGRLTTTTDALGNTTTYAYDQWSRQTSVGYADSSPKDTVVHDDIANPNTKTNTDPEGYTIKEYLDSLGRVTKKEETKKVGTGTQTNTLASFTYDYVGNVLTTTDYVTPQNVTIFGYDVLSRPTSVKNAKNEITSYKYDLMGNLTTIAYPDGTMNEKKYDEVGRLIQASEVPIGGKNNVEKSYYDGNGNRIGLRDRNNNHFKYTYTGRNFLWKKEIVDAAGNPIAGEETIEFSYDQSGRRKSMKDITGTTLYDFSPANGSLTKVTYPDKRTIQYDYDAAGNRSSMNDPFGINTYYRYDARNRLDTVSASIDYTNDFDAKYSYYNNNLLKNIRLRNGVTSDYAYDGLQINTLLQKKGSTVLNSFVYTYDNNGNQKTKTENEATYTFAYDPLNRIASSTQFNETYNYDNRGNRSSMTTNTPFERPDATTTFDKRDRLTNVSVTGGRNVSYKYNGDGLLWERTENGQTTRYYWDGDQVIAEATVSGGVATLKSRYIRGNGLVARQDSQGKAFYLHNGQGDVVNLMDSTGNTKLNSYSYDIFGNIASQSETIAQPFKYSAEMWDDTTKLQYLRARWYDPSVGRFINEDTYEGQLNNPLTQNLYTYAGNNPLRYNDPSGHCFICLIFISLPAIISASKNSIESSSRGNESSSESSLSSSSFSYINTSTYESTVVSAELRGIKKPKIKPKKKKDDIDDDWITYYQVTSKENAKSLVDATKDGQSTYLRPLEDTNGNSQPAHIYVFGKLPTKKQGEYIGARSYETVIELQIHESISFESDDSLKTDEAQWNIVKDAEPLRTTLKVNSLEIRNVNEVNFKSEVVWWNPFTWFK